MTTITATRRQPNKPAVRVLAALLLAGGLAVSGHTFADSYNVTASVPYDPPSQAAIVNPDLGGTTVNGALQTVSGTCQLMNPQAVVEIWRDGASIGSAPCTGTFSVQVMLQSGDNTLVAKTINASGQSGPDSAPLTVTLQLPAHVETPTNTSTMPSSPTTEVVSTNAGIASGLHAETADAFSTIDDKKSVTLQVNVAGGEHPYDIRIDWGDGSVDVRTVESAGTYEFTHAYQVLGSYLVHGTVRDVLGAYTEFDHAVVSGKATPQRATGTHSSGNTAGSTAAGTHWWQSTALAWPLVWFFVLLIFIGSYWLGWHRAKEKWSKLAAKQRKRLIAGGKRKKRKKS